MTPYAPYSPYSAPYAPPAVKKKTDKQTRIYIISLILIWVVTAAVCITLFAVRKSLDRKLLSAVPSAGTGIINLSGSSHGAGQTPGQVLSSGQKPGDVGNSGSQWKTADGGQPMAGCTYKLTAPAGTNAKVSVYSASGNNGSVIASIPDGEIVEVVDGTVADGRTSVYYVSNGKLLTGWANVSELTFYSLASVSGAFLTTSGVYTPGQTYIATADTPAKPAAGSTQTIETLPKNVLLEIVDGSVQNNEIEVYYIVDGRIRQGWVQTADLQFFSASPISGFFSQSSQTSAVSLVPNATYTIFNTGGRGLVVRVSPSRQSAKQTLLYDGAYAVILDGAVTNGYVRVCFRDSGGAIAEGYVSAAYLRYYAPYALFSETAATMTVAYSAMKAGCTYKVVGTGGKGLIARSAGSSAATRIASLAEGQFAQPVTGEVIGGYVWVSFVDAGIRMDGWVHAAYLTYYNNVPLSAQGRDGDFMNAGTYRISVGNSDTLPLRKNASVKGTKLANLENNSSVVVLEGKVYNNFVYVESALGLGWVNKNYLRYENANMFLADRKISAGVYRVVGVGKSSLALRSKYSNTSTLIAKLSEGTEVGVIQENIVNGYVFVEVYVNSDKKTGWVHQNYLAFLRYGLVSEPHIDDLTGGATYIVNVGKNNKLSVRQAANDKAQQIDLLADGDYVCPLTGSVSGTSVEVSYQKNGAVKTGWVHAQHLEFYSSSDLVGGSSAEPLTAGASYYVDVGGGKYLSARSSSADSAKQIASIPDGATVSPLTGTIKNKYVEVEFYDLGVYKTGWVHAEYLHFLSYAPLSAPGEEPTDAPEPTSDPFEDYSEEPFAYEEETEPEVYEPEF
ncbi:MAG: hypothetical protein IJK02_05560 [Clostridia bacterium]|nr:hypothetical protein [Clostridia bacterium]